jgi:hypothetical protein
MSYLSKMCCISIIEFVLTISGGVDILHTTYPYSMLSNKSFEPYSQVSFPQTQPSAHLILLAYVELFNLQMS